MKELKDFFKPFICNDQGKISKSKAGLWLGLIGHYLTSRGYLPPEAWDTIKYVAGGIFGIGIRDAMNKKS